MGQKGFATLEVILMVMVIGILASIAVPRFANIGAKANTAKIQADLSTIDTAIAVYELEKGTPFSDTTVKALVDAGYLQSEPKPPKGHAYVEGTLSTQPFSDESYGIKAATTTASARACLGNEENTAEDFYAPSSSGTTTKPTEGGTT